MNNIYHAIIYRLKIVHYIAVGLNNQKLKDKKTKIRNWHSERKYEIVCPSDLWSIHGSSQNPDITYYNLDFKGLSKTVFPSAF